MTTSYVSFDEGSTKQVRTTERTDPADGTVYEWMYAASEPILDAYTVAATNISGTTADSHLLQIMSGASNLVGIRRITIYQNAAANTTRQVRFALYRLSSAGTSGSSVTPSKLHPSSASNEAAAATLPTSKGTETDLVGGIHAAIIQSTITNQANGPLLDIEFGNDRERAMWSAAGTGNGMCIKNLVADSSVTYDIFVRFVEADWA